MAAEALIDTNIFLEIVMEQERSQQCKAVLRNYENRLGLSDFSLNSIGLYLFRLGREHLFLDFIRDIDGIVNIFGLELSNIEQLYQNSKRFHLDYDDSYQLTVAENYSLELLTLDNDFRGIDSHVKITIIR